MNTPLTTAGPLDDATILRVLQGSKAEAAAGRSAESDQILARLAQQAPNHPAVLNELGVRMFARGEAAQAEALFRRATAVDPKHPALWANLASALKALGRRAEEIDALDRALELQPRHLQALLQKAQYLEEIGDPRNAARAYQNALDSLPLGTPVPENVRAVLAHAKSVVDADIAALGRVLESSLAAMRERHDKSGRRRMDKCLDLLMRRHPRYVSQPTWMYFPELPAIEFFDRDQFPWLDAVEAATEEIRAELLQALVTDQGGLQPYIDFPPSMPLDQWRELNRSRRWSAYFLWNQGVPNADHIARCPATARVLEQHAPRCRIESRAPTAFFSLLEPKTRIPPHTGVTNTRLTVHLPLVVPPGCGFRVGGTTREWEPGKAWVFDDTIEHEAWNESDTPRAILIFDIWNPLLTEFEREMVTNATEAYVKYYDPSGTQPAPDAERPG